MTLLPEREAMFFFTCTEMIRSRSGNRSVVDLSRLAFEEDREGHVREGHF